MNMPFVEGIKQIDYAIKKENEDRYFIQWVQYLPYMSSGSVDYISFDDYVDKVTGRNIDTRSSADILAEVEEMHKIKIEV